MQAWVTNVTAKSSHTILRWRIKGTSLFRKTRKLACAFLRTTRRIGGALIVRFQVSVSCWLPPLPLGPHPRVALQRRRLQGLPCHPAGACGYAAQDRYTTNPEVSFSVDDMVQNRARGA
jgi:hypothetical protein